MDFALREKRPDHHLAATHWGFQPPESTVYQF